jgi:hypothetical protein
VLTLVTALGAELAAFGSDFTAGVGELFGEDFDCKVPISVTHNITVVSQ